MGGRVDIRDDLVETRAADLRPGDTVDLAGGKYFHGEGPGCPDVTEFEYGAVGEIEEESGLLVIDFENIGTAAYGPDEVFKIVRRDVSGRGAVPGEG